MTIELWITGIIGLIGVVLGVVNIAWNIKMYSPRVRIRTDIIVSSNPLEKPRYCIQVINTSLISISIEYISIGLKSKLQMIAPKTYSEGLPRMLSQGETVTAYYDGQALAKGLFEEKQKTKVRIRPYCKDATGKTYHAKWHTFNVGTFGVPK